MSRLVFSDGAEVLCHSEADIYRRVQHLSGGAGCCCADPVALQVGTLEEYMFPTVQRPDGQTFSPF